MKVLVIRIFSFRRNKIQERRKFPRKATRNLVSIESPQRQILNLNDLSERGAQLTSPVRLFQDQAVELMINLPELKTQIFVSGKVIWCNGLLGDGIKVYRVGVVFTHVGDETARLLRRFALNPFLRAA